MFFSNTQGQESMFFSLSFEDGLIRKPLIICSPLLLFSKLVVGSMPAPPKCVGKQAKASLQ